MPVRIPPVWERVPPVRTFDTPFSVIVEPVWVIVPPKSTVVGPLIVSAAPATVSEIELPHVLPHPTVSPATVAVVFTTTVYVPAPVTFATSPGPGTTAPDHFVGSFQFPAPPVH